MPFRHMLNDRQAYVFFACLSFAVLFMQVGHPALHPLEVINPGIDGQHACPLSHMAAALLVAQPLLLGAGLALDRLHNPLPWFGHSCLNLSLAPRPPPAHLP